MTLAMIKTPSLVLFADVGLDLVKHSTCTDLKRRLAMKNTIK